MPNALTTRANLKFPNPQLLIPSLAFTLPSVTHHACISTLSSGERRRKENAADAAMEASRPVVIEGLSSIELVNRVLNLNTPATFIACCTKEAFVEELLSHRPAADHSSQADDSDGVGREDSSRPACPAAWLERTLRMISTATRLSMVFCSDVGQLRAFLATFHLRKSMIAGAAGGSAPSESTLVVIMNLINLHRSTLSFSAQGINRTLSVAIDAALSSKQKLLIAECVSKASLEHEPNSEDVSELIGAVATESTDPWDEAVSILNVTTKSFGVGGRGWSGRTVTLRQIAERWFDFDTPYLME